MHTPITESSLEGLTTARLDELADILEFKPASGAKAKKAKRFKHLYTAGQSARVLRHLKREELRALCEAHDLPALRRPKQLIEMLSEGRLDDAPAERLELDKPHVGGIAQVRQRQYLIERVRRGEQEVEGALTAVDLVCLDDDDVGAQLTVFWELEQDAELVHPEEGGLGLDGAWSLDEPEDWGAYLKAIEWARVTATRGDLFQAPFRAGIHILHHQLTPLAKALSLPKTNLFIADDVGLGKTIEAGLVTMELLLRQRVDTILIVCPPSIVLQWRDEMSARFGLQFEIYNRDFVARRRRERGFGVNPWSTHSRFIVSYHTIKRPEHLDPLIGLGDRFKRSLLILDEAHTVAPASGSQYAVDSHITRVIREDVAPRFDNRLFLSATPHNGHSNSFSALLEILDPQRFTRGVPLEGPQALEPVMVRRLKRDLEGMAGQSFPVRRVEQYTLEHKEGRWWLMAPLRVDLGAAEPFELEMAELLEDYTHAMERLLRRKAGRLTLITLQKRLLSSPLAFYRTLKKHRAAIERRRSTEEVEEARAALLPSLGEAYGDDDALLEAEEDTQVARDSAEMCDDERAAALRERLYAVAEAHQHTPDARAKALLHWISVNQCPAVRLGGGGEGERAWSPRRVIIFTEYQSTLSYLKSLLEAAFEGTERAQARLAIFKGGMGDEARREIQRRFTDPKDDLRVLLATDAAREGLNLQAQCADLFHFDVPWNPARLEQRNGRIDRAMQPEEEVRCAYFSYPQRPTDRTLDALIRKLDTIRQELGSLGQVLLDRIEATLREGIKRDTAEALEAASEANQREREAAELLDGEAESRRAVRAEIDEARATLDRSRQIIQFEPQHLRRVLNVALERMGQDSMTSTTPPEGIEEAWALPEMPKDWQRTLDPLRPPRDKEEGWWAWRQRCPPKPVIFEPPPRLTEEVVLLHLEHPLVKRLLATFRAEGYRQGLSRVTAVMMGKRATPHALLIGRLTLFGPEARRLHDQLIYAAAPFGEESGLGEALPFDEAATLRRELDEALSRPRMVPDFLLERSKQLAPRAFEALWPVIEAEAEAAGHDAQLDLSRRGREEAKQLEALLRRQRAAIEARTRQMTFDFFEGLGSKEQRQAKDDRRYMERRLEALAREIEEEPGRLEALYATSRARLSPVGLVWMWGA